MITTTPILEAKPKPVPATRYVFPLVVLETKIAQIRVDAHNPEQARKFAEAQVKTFGAAKLIEMSGEIQSSAVHLGEPWTGETLLPNTAPPMECIQPKGGSHE